MDQAAQRRAAAELEARERATLDAREGVEGSSAASGDHLRPAQVCDRSRSASPDSPRAAILRPRSPTPTKMLAWEEAASGAAAASVTSPGDSDREHEDRYDGLIAQLIGACQMNEINKAFTFYEKLRAMQVPLYEGVYKMIIECCMRTQQLGHAMQFYETLKVSGQRVSSRLAIFLMEACAKEQHGDKVHAIWSDWCPPGEPVTAADSQVFLVAVSALVRTMSPDLAASVLQDAMQRSGDGLDDCLADAEVELEELIQLNEQMAEEASANGTLLEDLAGRFGEVNAVLQGLHERCLQMSETNSSCARAVTVEDVFMEDLDLDLDLAAM